MDDGAAFELLSVCEGIKEAVIGPELVRAGRRERTRPAVWRLQPRCPPPLMGTIGTYQMALMNEKLLDA